MEEKWEIVFSGERYVGLNLETLKSQIDFIYYNTKFWETWPNSEKYLKFHKNFREFVNMLIENGYKPGENKY